MSRITLQGARYAFKEAKLYRITVANFTQSYDAGSKKYFAFVLLMDG